ncbi:MAG: hypothetical protein K2W95_04960 [Candidatus Obscuribacterales bacterium]|nr:hypothetical protein [Candidatus Obscuribacterales bacterium]
MRSDSEIKTKIVELLGIQGEQRTELIQAMDKLDITALQLGQVDTHSVRGMLSALYWTLGYTFADIREHLVERSLSARGPSYQPGRETMQGMRAFTESEE